MLKNKTSISKNNLTFRPAVGIMIINKEGKIFVGKRIDAKMNNGWQMPQGGIDLGETPSSAALREMTEEIGCNNGEIVAESQKWYCYRLPDFIAQKLWKGKYCGQKQKWFLIKFTGQDSDINIRTRDPEFISWKWVNINKLLKIIVPFKYKLYSKVIKEFKEFL